MIEISIKPVEVGSAAAKIDFLPLPTAMAHLAEQKRVADRALQIGGPQSHLVPLIVALARLAARRDAVLGFGDGRT